MKRHFVVSLVGSFVGFGLLLILLGAAGMAGAQSVEVQADVPRPDEVSAATPLTSTFTYQGQLKNSGVAVTGLCQMAFRLYDDPASGSLIGSPITATVPITNGLFTVGLNFGAAAFDGSGRWLDIQVDCDGGFVPLPRQAITAAPYSLFALSTGALQGRSITTTAPGAGQVLKWTGGAWSPADDEIGSPGSGDISAVTAGYGLSGGGTIGDVTLNVVTSTIQQRVSGACASGSSIRSVNPDGTVTCETDDNTTYSAGTGLVLTGMSFSADTSWLQRRVSSNCAVGNAIREIYYDGTVTCQPVTGGSSGDITGVYAGTGLTGGGATGEVTLMVNFSGTGSAGTVARSDHAHAGADITSGTVAEARIDSLIARDSEITPTVAAAGFITRTLADALYTAISHNHWGASWNGAGTGLTLSGGSTGLAASGSTYGVSGTTPSGPTNIAFGVYGQSGSRAGYGVYGNASNATGTTYGVYGQVASPNGWAGSFSTGVGNGVYITAPNGTGLNVASGAALVAGNTIWHAGNDGPTSGLNADLLEGQHGSYYLNASNIQGGTLNTDNYSAYSDLSAEGYLDNNASTDLLTRAQSDGRYWLLGGNAVTTDTVLGTTGNYALDIRVNNARILRLEPNATSPNIIGGYSGNSAASGVHGATIGGGGTETSSAINQVTANYGTVSGGMNNDANGQYATVGGGASNVASGPHATVGGGGINDASGQYATVGGGQSNDASDSSATVGGGYGNVASGPGATVGGGKSNDASGDYATVIGGYGASAPHHGEFAYGGGEAQGQSSLYVLSQQTTNTTEKYLYLDGGFIDEVITITSGRAVAFEILVVAHSATNESAGYKIQGLIENQFGTVAFVGTPSYTVLGEDDAAWNIWVEADDTLDALMIRVQGNTTDAVNWTASVRTTESF